MRLIDADALMEQLIKKKAGVANGRYTEGFNDALMRFRSMVSSAAKYSSIDAVEVVRCRDCKLYYDGNMGRYCQMTLCAVEANNFCSCGKRKEQ